MKTLSLLISCCLLAGRLSATPPSSEELAQFLEVESWHSIISIPADQFIAEIYIVRDGKVGDLVVPSPAPHFMLPEGKATILISPQGGKYQIFVDLGTGMGIKFQTQIPQFKSWVPESLPPQLAEGDYMLAGRLRDGWAPGMPIDASQYAEGFLLRVKRGTFPVVEAKQDTPAK